MLKPFYNYLAQKVVDYFSRSSVKPGERFYLQLDEKEQVECFYEVLLQYPETELFRYTHEKGVSYQTISLNIKGVSVIVVSTQNVTPGYLVTLRNNVSEQKGIWNNTALFVICDNAVDSVYGGMANLQQKGMPLHSQSIIQNLKEEIDSSALNKTEKEVTKFYLNNKVAESVYSTVWDYEEVLGIIQHGRIERTSYRELGLFYDQSLEDFTHAKQIEKRLTENHSFFEKVSHAQEFDDTKEQLEVLFDSTGTKKLLDDNWHLTDFSDVKNSNERLSETDTPLMYDESPKKLTQEGLIYWEKPKDFTKAGSRKRHIIVFNPNNKPQVSLVFNFDRRLDKAFITRTCEKFTTISGKKLNVSFNVEENEPTFKKVSYKHKKQAKSSYEFNILVVPFEPSVIEGIKTGYLIDNKFNRLVVADQSEHSNFTFGQGVSVEEVVVNDQHQIVELKAESSIKISDDSQAWDESSLHFKLSVNHCLLSVEIKEEQHAAFPVKSIVIWKQKREQETDFIYTGTKVIQGGNSYYIEDKFKQYLELEKQIIEVGYTHAISKLDELIEKPISLSPKLKNSYEAILGYYRRKDNVPSLVYLDDELKKLYYTYILAFNQEVASIEENSILSDLAEKRNLLKLGTIVYDDKVLVSPLSPLSVIYQLEFNNETNYENIERHILERLNARNLLPYMYHEEVLYRSIQQEYAHEWTIYEQGKHVSLGETNAFMANVVKEKINQFISHFTYLFHEEGNAPVNINLIDIENNKEVVRGVINFIKDRIVAQKRIIGIDLNIYSHNATSQFDTLFSLTTAVEVESMFNVNLTCKHLDAQDVLRLIQDNINYYKHSDTKQLNYAHISFVKVGYNTEQTAVDNMDQIETGLTLNGLLSSVTSITERSRYRTGFGTRNILNNQSQLVETAIHLNELAVNGANSGQNPYNRNKTIVTLPMSLNKSFISEVYNQSHWVTFIEPSFGLEYFDQYEEDLLVIHYSEQYSSSDKYDTITVTNKSKQYKQIIKEFLLRRQITANDDELEHVIKTFNSINGEWLLNIMTSHGEYEREKLSIISAIKYGLAILDHPDITWVPISMEEILRISGAVKLNKSEGIFTVKNLKQRGVHSDDLLFIGIETKGSKVKLYYYPIEVKVGYNFESTVLKGKNQINKTFKLIQEQLCNEVDESYPFKKMFFRNFFIKVLLTNVQKLIVNHIWDEKQLESIEKLKDKLQNDEYDLSFELAPFIGKGALISFKKDNFYKSVKLEDEIYVVELTEDDAYSGIVKPVAQLHQDIQNGNSDLDVRKLLSRKDLNDLTSTIVESIESEQVSVEEEIVEALQEIDVPEKTVETELEVTLDDEQSPHIEELEEINEVDQNHDGEMISTHQEEMFEETLVKPIDETIRVHLGVAEGSTKEIFWEYGHKGLGNRHMLIEGKSGQGKTYFIQCMLKELSDNRVPSIIIDYTEGFKKTQLEDEFKEYLEDNLQMYLVARDKFPLNPFKRNEKELDEDFYIPEDNIDIAERFKSVIGAVYDDLGAQQLNCIYQATIRGLEKYGDNMNLKYLKEELLADSSGPAKTALAQLSLLIDKDPFKSGTDFSWDNILCQQGSVFIIQLTGYTRDVQKIITEIILWDLWHHKLQQGSKDKPFAVVLDEAQNLDFGDYSPCTRILTEGRKFGWSAWFATQFLKGKMNKAAISRLQNAAQKIYFSPADEVISDVATIIGKDDKKTWEKRLSELKKGECVVYGQMRKSNDELSANVPIKIKITSLNERIK